MYFSRWFKRAPRISGFMIVRDVVSQGYPYLEAIASLLPICDEFLISDGCSSDRTWEGLEILQARFPKKIRLFREPWEGSTENGEILATMTNRLRARCRGDYCFNLQANEVLPSESLKEILLLPQKYPRVDLFCLPFLSMMGKQLAWMTESRSRFFRNLPEIVSRGDAYDVGPVAETGIEWKSKKVELAQPFVRYRGLYPVNFIRKTEGRLALFRSEFCSYHTLKELTYAKDALAGLDLQKDSPDIFWEKIRIYLDQVQWENVPGHLQLTAHIPRQMLGFQKTILKEMSHLPDTWEYNLNDSLEQVKNPFG